MDLRLQASLLAVPNLNDHENWTNYLSQQLSFPFEARLRGNRGAKTGATVQVYGIHSFNEQGVVMVTKEAGKKAVKHHQLAYLQATDENSKAFQVLEDYLIWVAKQY